MGGRGSWSETAKGERVISGGQIRFDAESQKQLTAYYQTISGNRTSPERTFRNVERMITQHTYETGLIVDSQGFVLAAYKGGKNSVNFGPDSGLARGNTVTHNHPSGAAAPSVADIRSAGAMGVIAIRAATKSNGTAVLEKASNNPQWDKMASDYDAFIGNGKTVREAREWLFRKAKDYGLRFTVER